MYWCGLRVYAYGGMQVDNSVLLIIIIVLIMIWHENEQMILRTIRRIRKRGRNAMASELLKAFIGKTCQITTGQFGSMRGTVTAVDGN